MIASIQSNVSGMQAFSKQMAVSADNVANAFSDDFKKSRAVHQEGSNGQVQTVVSKVNTPGPLVDDPASEMGRLKEVSNTDLAEEMTAQITASHGFKANARVISTHEETLGSLLDIIG